jgi:hypothetical protein
MQQMSEGNNKSSVRNNFSFVGLRKARCVLIFDVDITIFINDFSP